MLYVMSVAKLIFPLLTFPYLARVLSKDANGFYTYVKSCMNYMELIVEFGFILSSVKDIVKADGDAKRIGEIVGNTVAAKLLLSVAAAAALAVMCLTIDILKIDLVFVAMSFVTVVTGAFLLDFLFRGIERMHYITIIYVISKGLSTALIFVLVKGDDTMRWIPVLDITANLVSIGISVFIVSRLRIRPRVTSLAEIGFMLKDSSVYFLSNVASSAFAALNTVLIGIFIKDLTEVAYWGFCLTITSAIQGLYAPVCNGIYPYMIKQRSLSFIHKTLRIFMPIVTAGCIACFFLARTALLIAGGEKYVEAYTLFRWMIPILFFSFPAQVYGWPTLGAIGKNKETTLSTIIAAVIQVAGLALLAAVGRFTLVALACLRGTTELILLLLRVALVYKNKSCFRSGDEAKGAGKKP